MEQEQVANQEAEEQAVNQKTEPKKGKKAKKDKPKRTVGQEIMSWVVTLLAAIVIASLVRMFIFEPIRVDGRSMSNTLADGEIVFCSKIDYLTGDPQRGDIVICRYPNRNKVLFNIGASIEVMEHTLFVKRVVAVPGDIIEMVNGVLFVNGVQVENPEKMGSATTTNYPRTQLGEDEYFVMGDNRGNSHDSRASDVGPISRSAIMGKVKCVLFPFNQIRSVE